MEKGIAVVFKALLLIGVLILAACGGGGGGGGGGSSSSTSNTAPIANAGSAQSVNTGATVTLNGSGSDADGDALTYLWVLTSKPAGSIAVLSNASSQRPTFVADLAGNYVAQLVVSDGKVFSSNMTSVTIAASVVAGFVSPGNTGKPNDTGITNVGYDAAGSYTSSCPSTVAGNDCNTGRDATANDIADGRAGFSFTKIAADGAALPASATSWSCVKDNVTGLIWENKTIINGGATYTNYDDLAKNTQLEINAQTNSIGFKNTVNSMGLCGASDWRLPTASELMGLVDYSVASSGITIDGNWFAYTPQKKYWSSTGEAGSGNAWNVGFGYGDVNYSFARSVELAVRLVRSSQASVASRYQVSSDGQEVTDTRSNLIWRRCVEGMSWNGSVCTGSATLFTHANALLLASTEAAVVGGKTWRLPNVKELESIVDRSRSNPSIDITAFPSTPANNFWSSSANVGNTANAWSVYFNYGLVYDYYRNSFYAVRLVRSGQ